MAYIVKTIKENSFVCIFFATLIFVSTTKADAQQAEIGLRFLPGYSSFAMKNADGSPLKGQSKSGYGIAAILSRYLSEHIGVQGEVMYNTISQTYKEQNLQREIDLKYINIPLLLSFNTGRSAPVNVNITAGPQLSINTESNLKTYGVDASGNAQPVLSVNRAGLSAVYGAGFDYEMSHSAGIRMCVGFRGSYGITNMANNNKTVMPGYYYILDKPHLNTASIYVGVSFPIK